MKQEPGDLYVARHQVDCLAAWPMVADAVKLEVLS